MVLTISDKLYLEMILLEVRTATMSYSKQKRLRTNNQETRLISEITHLENTTPQGSDIIKDKKQELEDIRQEKLKGHMVRAKVEWLTSGEKPTKYFCGFNRK